MATTSFKKQFIVSDKDAARRLESDVRAGKPTVSYTKKDEAADRKKGDNLLARLASA